MSDTSELVDKFSLAFLERIEADRAAWQTVANNIKLEFRDFAYQSYVRTWLMNSLPKKAEPSMLVMALVARCGLLAKESKQ